MKAVDKQVITGEKYILRLFVAGDGLESTQAEERIVQLCESQLQQRYELDVIDVLENPVAALDNHVVVTPMLILVEPPPRVTILGDLRDTDKVLAAFLSYI